MSHSDGSVIIDAKIDTDGIDKGVKDIENGLEGIGKGSSKASEAVGGGLANSFKKLGAAMAAAGVVDALIDFGKQAIELGSDLEEVQNVVDVTFSTMSKEVNKFAKNAQKTAGMSEKMAKQYVGTFGAMADSFGFTEQEAYEMSTALTQLTGDVASFYNLSQDEAMNKLKGVFTGESEALKELGVVMTQTALDAYAMSNGFAKTTADMTEQEKVALRYQFVMDQLSSASGDFVRTQEGWANQSRVLSLQWESLMATLGSGLIDVLSPSVQFLNEKVLPALQSMAEWLVEAHSPVPSQELEKSLKKSTKAIQTAAEQHKKNAEEIESSAIMAGIYKDRLLELEATGVETAESQAAYAAVIEQLNTLFPELNLQVDEQTGLLDENSRAQLQNLDLLKERYFLMAAEEEITAIAKERAEIELSIAKAVAEREIASNNLAVAEQKLAETSEMTLVELEALYDATDGGARAIENMDGSAVALTGTQAELIKSIKESRAEVENLNEGIEKGQKLTKKYDDQILSLRDAYGLAAEGAEDYGDAQEQVSASVEETQTALQELEAEYATASEEARESIDSQIGLFDELTVKSDKSASEIVKNWESQQAAFESYKENLEKAVDMGLDETLVKQLSDGSEESMAILDEFVNSTDTSVDDINDAFRKTQESKKTVSATMADIQTDMSKKLSSIEADVEDSWGDMAVHVRNAIREMQANINSLKGKTVTLEVKTKNQSQHIDVNTGLPVSYSAAPANVPYLASGAVIPPRAPFMAMLGDQRHGTNIEAPLSTIQEAVRAEVGGIAEANNATVAVLTQILETVAGIELGDTVIGQAAERYNRHMGIMNGGY